MTSRVDETLCADISLFLGSSGSGKSHQIKQSLQAFDRLMVFDPEYEYAQIGAQVVESIPALIEYMKVNIGKEKVAFVANGQKAFDQFCTIAFNAAHARYPLCVAVDELAGVTTIGKAPPAWHTLVSRGRKYGIKIRAGAQRPTEIDKTVIANRTALWCGYMSRPADRRYISDEIGIDLDLVNGLRGRPYFDAVIQSGHNPPAARIAKAPVKGM